MPTGDAATLSGKALSELRDRIEGDSEIGSAVKQALLADLAGEDTTGFVRLRAALTGEGNGDEAEVPEGE